MRNPSRLAGTLALLSFALVAGLLAPGRAQAAPSPDRRAYFAVPAFHDCYISVYNASSHAVTLSWSVSGSDGTTPGTVGSGGGFSWNHVWAKYQEPGTGTAMCVAPCSGGNLPANTTVKIAFTKHSEALGVFTGWLKVAEQNGQVMATGQCVSSDTNVPFVIQGGTLF